MQKKELFVVKIGGNVIDDDAVLDRFLDDFCEIEQAKILVHGGGKIATRIAEKLGFEAVMVDGRRVTDENMLQVVTMVYGGLVNKNIVAKLQARKCNAIGLTGADGGVILSEKRPVAAVDYGFVGDVKKVDAKVLSTFIETNLSPVMAPLTFDNNGTMLNTNADTIASEVAVAMAENYQVSLIYCFELNGVLQSIEQPDSVIPLISSANIEVLKNESVLSKGMIPKVDNAMSAVRKGVEKVHICHASHILPISKKVQKGTIVKA